MPHAPATGAGRTRRSGRHDACGAASGLVSWVHGRFSFRLFPLAPGSMPTRRFNRPTAALTAQARLQRGRLLLALVVQLEVVAPALGAQLAGVQRHLYGAARLAAMAAIGEAALLGEPLDIGKQVEVFLAGEFQLAHAGGVDQATAAGQLQQRAMGGGVAAATVVAA